MFINALSIEKALGKGQQLTWAYRPGSFAVHFYPGFPGFASQVNVLAYRELDSVLGLTDLGEYLLNDWRTGKNTQHSMVALMRQSVFQMAEVAVPRELFRAILEGIRRLRLPAGASG